MLKHLVIIGVGGFARECYWHAQGSIGYDEDWDIKGFLDGDVKLKSEEYEKLELPLLGDVDGYEVQPEDVFICAIGNGMARKKFAKTIMRKGGTFINLIHKTAMIHGNAKMGIGNIFCHYTHLQDHAVIGDFVVCNNRSGLGHDAKLGSYSSLMSNAELCGFVQAGENTYWATNAVAVPHSKIGDNVYVGVNSSVLKRVKSGQTVFGNPAMPI